MNANDPLIPLKRLQEMFAEAALAEGGRLVHFGISPGKREVLVLVDLDDNLFLDEQGKETLDAFAEIEKNFHVERKEERAADAVRDLSELERRLASPEEGIL